MKNGKPVGSELIGQQFDELKYFWGRISATTPYPYNGGSSSGSNLGPNNPDLVKAVHARINALRDAAPRNDAKIPVDLATASGSGSIRTLAPPQPSIRSVASRRRAGSNGAAVRALVAQHTQEPWLGIIGEPVVNVLAVNLALDERR